MGIRTVKFPRYHTGRGLGQILAKIGYFVKPLLRSAVKATKPIAKQVVKDLARQGIDATAATVGDLIAGENPRQAIKKNAKIGLQKAKSTLATGSKRALSESVRSGIKTIKRQKMQSGGRSRKKSVRKKAKKRPYKKKPYKGIFQ